MMAQLIVMNTLTNYKTGTIGILGVLALVTVVSIAPHVFAITYTDANNPHGPMAVWGWTAGLAIAGVLSGVGFFTAVRRRKHSRD